MILLRRKTWGLSLLFAFILGNGAMAQSTGFFIPSIVVSKNCVETKSIETQVQANDNPDCPMAGDTQLIQVTVENASPDSKDIRIQVDIHRDGARVNRHVEQRLLPSSGEYKLLYSYKIPQQGGQYRVSSRVFDAKNRRLLAESGPGVNREFYILKQSDIDRVAEEKALLEAESARVPQKLEFDPADLRWDKLHVVPKHVLRGEKFQLRLDLINVGGDIARSIKAQVSFYNVRLPRRRTAIAAPQIDVLAPGETVTFELEYAFPDDQLLGEYQILAIVDPTNLVPESKEDNNQLASDVMRLSDIKLLLPPDSFVFEETGLFLFQWDSLAFREFKVQIGIDDKFEDPSSYFNLPQGDRWIADKELVPLSGELPTMGQGLLNTFQKSVLYWRVVGRKSDGKQSFSTPRTFSVRAENSDS